MSCVFKHSRKHRLRTGAEIKAAAPLRKSVIERNKKPVQETAITGIVRRILMEVISFLFIFGRQKMPGRNEHQAANLAMKIVPSIILEEFTGSFLSA